MGWAGWWAGGRRLVSGGRRVVAGRVGLFDGVLFLGCRLLLYTVYELCTEELLWVGYGLVPGGCHLAAAGLL